MRKKPFLLAAAGVVAALAVFQTVGAQTPQPNPFPATPVRTASELPPAGQPVRPAGGFPQQPPGGVVHAAVGQPARSRPSTAVIAGADGVRPATAFDLPQPNLDMQSGKLGAGNPPLPAFTLPPPVVSQEPTAPGAQIPTVPTLPIPTPTPVPTPTPLPTPIPNPVSLPAPVPSFQPPLTTNEPVATPITRPTPVVTPAPLTTGTATLAGKVTQTVTLEAVCPEAVVFGGEFRYELLVKNSGTAPVMGVRVEDELPAGAKFLGSEPQAELNADRLSWSIGTLEAGAEKRIVVRVKPVEEGDLRSRATVSYTAAVEARTRVTRPKITVAVTGPETAKAGEEPTFQIKITNSGSGPAQGMVLQAFLSDGLVHPAGAKLEIKDMATLPPGESKLVPLKVAAGKAGAQWCQVVVAAQGSQDATAKASVNVLEAQLQIAQVGPTRCFVRAEPVYEITLSNPGTAATDPVSLYAVLPEGLDYIQGSDGATFNNANRAVIWKIAGIAPGGSKTFSLKVRATAESDGSIRMIAQAVADQSPQGIATVGGIRATGRVLEAKTETPIKAEGVAAVRFEVLDLDDPVEVGKEATYEVRVTNQGTGACTNVRLAAALGEGASYVGSSGPTQVKAQGQTLVFDPIPNLGVKGEAVYRVKVRGGVAGDIRFRVQLTCDQVKTPVVKEESTRFVKP